MTSLAKMPRIVIDARMCGPQGHGIGLYVEELAHSLHSKTSLRPLFLIGPNCPHDSILRNFPHTTVRTEFLDPKEAIVLPMLLKDSNASFYLSPSFSSLLWYPCPHGIILHDLNHLRFGGVAHKIYYQTLVRRACATAQRIFCVSYEGQKEIAAWLRKDRQQIRVAPNSVLLSDVQSMDAWLSKHSLVKRKYFISLAGEKEHKNRALLLRAYREYRMNSSQPWPLVLPRFNDHQEGVLSFSALTYPEVMGLLRDCGALISPSLYEGFSRPPVEGALLGTTVAVSDIGVHREVLSGVEEAIYVDAENVGGWVRALAQIEASPKPIDGKSKELLRQRYNENALLRGLGFL